MDHALQRLAKLSQEIARKAPLWTQGQGGNVSLKVRNQLLVKASGTRLDGLEPDRGWSTFDLTGAPEKLKHLLSNAPEQESEGLYATFLSEGTVPGEGFGRPSMETGFHVLLSSPWVLHFHSLAAVLMSHLRDTRSPRFEKWLSIAPSSTDIHFLPYRRPGLQLSRSFIDETPLSFIVLANHGVILKGSSEDVLSQWLAVEVSFFEFFQYSNLADVLCSPNPIEKSLELVVKKGVPGSAGPFFPDSVIFSEELEEFRELTLPKLQRNNFDLRNLTFQEMNALELWLAESLLAQVEPTLKPISKDEHRILKGLPTEVLRKQASESRNL